MFKDLHEDQDKAGPVRHDSTPHGRNRDVSEYPESGYLRCLKCGYTMNKYRHPKPKTEGDGISHETANTFTREGYTLYDGAEPTVTRGCPFCGSHNYE